MKDRKRFGARSLGLLVLCSAAAVVSPAGGSSSSPTAGAVPVPATTAACPSPYRPSVTYPNDGPPPVPSDPLQWDSGPIDTDGDGAADTIGVAGTTIHIDRASGSLDLPDRAVIADREHPVDVDGDGTTDLFVIPPTGPAVLLPGSTASGQVDLEAAGIRLPAGFEHAQFVGDQDGDGASEVAVERSGSTEVFSGVDLAAPGPGASFAGDPIARLDGALLGLVPFDPAVPTLVTSPDATDDAAGRPVTLVVHSDPEVVLTTAGSPLVLPPYAPEDRQAAAMLYAEGARSWIVLGQQSRAGGSGWVWELTDLCRTSTAPAPGAEAIAGSPGYTG
ncbi:hypothetical protein BH10ACT1_BH10ACT1_25360 [soil metagenome]